MMEGISHEACSLAGTLGLGKLIIFWDDNGISIDGKVKDWFEDDTPKRFDAYGWHVVEVDGHDADEIKIAIEAARAISAKPSKPVGTAVMAPRSETKKLPWPGLNLAGNTSRS